MDVDMGGEQGRKKFINAVDYTGKAIKYAGMATSETGVGALLIPIGQGIEFASDAMDMAGSMETSIELGSYENVLAKGTSIGMGEAFSFIMPKEITEIGREVVGDVMEEVFEKNNTTDPNKQTE